VGTQRYNIIEGRPFAEVLKNMDSEIIFELKDVRTANFCFFFSVFQISVAVIRVPSYSAKRLCKHYGRLTKNRKEYCNIEIFAYFQPLRTKFQVNHLIET